MSQDIFENNVDCKTGNSVLHLRAYNYTKVLQEVDIFEKMVTFSKIQPNMEQESPFTILIGRPDGETILEQLSEECKFLKIYPSFSIRDFTSLLQDENHFK